MKQDALAKWLKFIIVGVGFCGLLTYTIIMPRFAAYLVRQNSMLEKNVLPWLILIWISAIPCYAVLVLGWKIADNIRRDRSFSYENAEYLKWVSYLSMADAVFTRVSISSGILGNRMFEIEAVLENVVSVPGR